MLAENYKNQVGLLVEVLSHVAKIAQLKNEVTNDSFNIHEIIINKSKAIIKTGIKSSTLVL